jgi:hypothetical protein
MSDLSQINIPTLAQLKARLTTATLAEVRELKLKASRILFGGEYQNFTIAAGLRLAQLHPARARQPICGRSM